MLDEDRLPAIVPWFKDKIAGLPKPMTAELRTWFRVMRRGSGTPPRRRPRSDITIRVHLRFALPALQTWAGQGHQSLREITSDQVRAILPPAGSARATLGSGLRSIFTILKTEKVIFANPIARIPVGSTETTYPLPAKVTAVRAALDSPNPAAALMAALLAFHGLRTRELRNLKTTDIRDGRLYLDDRVIPLADPVRVRLTAYLSHRQQHWPATANPYLFIHRNTACTIKPFGSRWAGLLLGMSPRVIREDRILHEIHATGGDVRRVCEMFGYSVSGAMRYLNTLDPPGIDASTPARTGST